jgi:DNA-binding transcriptional regulator YiaG
MSFQPRPQNGRARKRSSATKSLAERLYEWRRKKDFSQSEAAVKLQISKRTLQEWEQGRAEPRHLALDAINLLIKQ